jgi:hypothetical protein
LLLLFKFNSTFLCFQIDEKTKVRVSQTLKRNLQKQQAWGGATTVKKQISGTASSVAFTPLQVLITSVAVFVM